MNGEHVPEPDTLDFYAVETALIAASPDRAVEKTRANGVDQTMLAGQGDRGAVDLSYSPQLMTTTC